MPKDADQFQNGFAAALRYLGWDVALEVPADYTVDGKTINGRIDVVARKDGRTVAFELDGSSPRKKSFAKLASYVCDESAIICRNGKSFLPNSENTLGESDKILNLKGICDYSELVVKDFVSAIQAASNKSNDLIEFVKNLEDDRFIVFPNVSVTTTTFHGFRFMRDEVSLTGRKIGFKVSDLEAMGLGYDPDRHHAFLLNRRNLYRIRQEDEKKARIDFLTAQYEMPPSGGMRRFLLEVESWVSKWPENAPFFFRLSDEVSEPSCQNGNIHQRLDESNRRYLMLVDAQDQANAYDAIRTYFDADMVVHSCYPADDKTLMSFAYEGYYMIPNRCAENTNKKDDDSTCGIMM